MAIKAVLFDFGGVLAFHATTVLAAKLKKKFGIQQKDLVTFWRIHEDNYDIGKVTPI